MADKKYSKLSVPSKKNEEEDFEKELLGGMEDLEDMEGLEDLEGADEDLALEDEGSSDIAEALAGFSKEEIEEYLATMESSDELEDEEDLA